MSCDTFILFLCWRKHGKQLPFFNYATYEDKRCKLVLEGERILNVISKFVLFRIQLIAKPHSKPFNVTWVNKTSLQMREQDLVPTEIVILTEFDVMYYNQWI